MSAQTTTSPRPERTTGTHPKLWSVQDVAEYLGVPVRTLYQWRSSGYGPPVRRMGKYLRYKPDDVTAWFDALTDPAV